ncbi:MAG: hypothetical protein GY716_22085 [bacterium]|nr:hypothetical protein [bacterium]
MRAVVCIVLAALACLAGCSEPPPPVDPSIVAFVDGDAVRIEEFDDYLTTNLGQFEGDPGTPESDQDLVKSRLFDAMLDEHVLLREALRRRIEVSRYEIDAFLRDVQAAEADRPAGRDARERIERLLRIHKLQESILRALPAMTPEEALAYLDEHPDLAPSGPRLTVRALMLESKEQADKVHSDLSRKRMTFDEAAVAYEQGPSAGEPIGVSVDSLPEEVRTALEKVRRGRISKPVELHGSFYVFRVESRAEANEPVALDPELLELLDAMRRREAFESELAVLRARTEVRIEPANLPFSYVPDQQP